MSSVIGKRNPASAVGQIPYLARGNERQRERDCENSKKQKSQDRTFPSCRKAMHSVACSVTFLSWVVEYLLGELYNWPRVAFNVSQMYLVEEISPVPFG